MALSQDQAKIAHQILSALRYSPADGKAISEILSELDKLIIDKTGAPTVTILPEDLNVKIYKSK